jgi:hypothetical protein
MRPYRFINTFELNQINKRFQQIIEHWNNDFSLHPIHLAVRLPSLYEAENIRWSISNSLFQPLAVSNTKIHELLNYCLFGELNSYFDQLSDELFLSLMSQLLNSDSCFYERLDQVNYDWIYQGSPCLLVQLNCQSHQLALLLNPSWVHKNLLPLSTKQPTTYVLEELLGKKLLTMRAELNPMKIPFNQLVDLQIGDVLLTDHGINQPIRLLQKEKPFASADLGQMLENKSLFIKEFI